MKVFIATIGREWWNEEVATHFRVLAARDRVKHHILVDDPDRADVILFVDIHQHELDWSLKGLRCHPLVQRYPLKVMVYDERDKPHCTFPGLFVCMPASGFDAKRQRAFSYYQLKNELMGPEDGETDVLFSFLGARTHAVRDEILKLQHPRAVIQDTSQVNFFNFTDEAKTSEYQHKIHQQKEHYKSVVARSKFVLCPRGWGTSSFRLYETLAAGRVPVIISDEWVPSPCENWEACSVRVPESEVASIPRLLEEREEQWPTMARAARRLFDEWMGPEMIFHRLGDECQWLLSNGEMGRQRFQWQDRAFLSNGKRHYLDRLRRLRARLRRSDIVPVG
ncbi:hypothetical protein IAD21_06251 [Abditibacteriota bacterium]|nr:hypothetical protein IAD21_06251 [Abditibacteriota bacterium]